MKNKQKASFLLDFRKIHILRKLKRQSGSSSITCVGVGQRIGLPLDATRRSSIFIYLLHRVEVNSVHSAQGRQADLIFPVLVGCL